MNGTVTDPTADLRRPGMLSPELRGLLYKEWLGHRPLLMGFAVLWLVGAVTQLFHHPAWIFALGLLYGAMVAPLVAGRDAAEGTEEFDFALPPHRGTRYLVRLGLAGGGLVVLLVLGLGSLALQLPQRLWGLVVETGFTESYIEPETAWWVYAATAPLGLAGCTFALASLGSTRTVLGTAWLAGLLVTGAVGGGGIILEALCWEEVTGLIGGPLLAALAVVAPFVGYQLYRRKEAVGRPAGAGGVNGRTWWPWLVAGLGLFFLLLLLLAWGRSEVAREAALEKAEMETEAAMDAASTPPAAAPPADAPTPAPAADAPATEE